MLKKTEEELLAVLHPQWRQRETQDYAMEHAKAVFSQWTKVPSLLSSRYLKEFIKERQRRLDLLKEKALIETRPYNQVRLELSVLYFERMLDPYLLELAERTMLDAL